MITLAVLTNHISEQTLCAQYTQYNNKRATRLRVPSWTESEGDARCIISIYSGIPGTLMDEKNDSPLTGALSRSVSPLGESLIVRLSTMTSPSPLSLSLFLWPATSSPQHLFSLLLRQLL